ncbi:hypothetical protein [Paenibacillus alkalitolerans]|nr:hypothetical protein [Paenibacillus alkalitolerans]
MKRAKRRYQAYYKGRPYGDPVTTEQMITLRSVLLNVNFKPLIAAGYRAI